MRADWSSFTQWHFSLPRFPLPALPRGWSAPLSSCHQYFLCLFLFASARKCALNPGTGGVHLLPHPYPCKYPVVCPIRWHGGGADGWEEVRRHLSGETGQYNCHWPGGMISRTQFFPPPSASSNLPPQPSLSLLTIPKSFLPPGLWACSCLRPELMIYLHLEV